MKKIFFAVLALAGLAACSTEDVVSRPEGAVIGFDTFVNNSTRANDINANNLTNFGVYGSVVNSSNQQGMIFTNQEVTGSKDNGYSYSPEQYWIAGATYNFVAFAPFTDAQWAYDPTVDTAAESGVLTFNNTGANQDLLFATATKTTDTTLTASPGAVEFTFSHVLSRVRFTFTNGFISNGNIKLLVTNVNITDAYAEGKMAVPVPAAPAKAWTVESSKKTLKIDFDDVLKAEGSAEADARLAEGQTSSTEHFYLIPANASYNVTFTVALYQAGVLVDTYDRTATLSYDMQPGYSYDIKATLNPENTSDEGEIFPIEFQVSGVNGWANNGEWTNVNATVNEPTNN